MGARLALAAPPPPPPPPEVVAANDNAVETFTRSEHLVVRLAQGPVAGVVLLAAGAVFLKAVGAF